MTSNRGGSLKQFTTFYLGPYQFGIDVMRVQEVTDKLSMTQIPRSPAAVQGLINLRGQIATAIGLRELFGLDYKETDKPKMTVICKVDGVLLSLLVDSIGDVIEISDDSFEGTPETLRGPVRDFMNGVYKTKENIFSVIDLDKLNHELSRMTGLSDSLIN